MKKSKILLSLLTPFTVAGVLTPIVLTTTACSESTPTAPATFYANSSRNNTFFDNFGSLNNVFTVGDAEEMKELFINGKYTDNMIKWDLIASFCMYYPNGHLSEVSYPWTAEFTYFKRSGINLEFNIHIKSEASGSLKETDVFTCADDTGTSPMSSQEMKEFEPQTTQYMFSYWRIRLNDAWTGAEPMYWGGYSPFVHLY